MDFSAESITKDSIRAVGRRLVEELLNQGDLAVADLIVDSQHATCHRTVKEDAP